jgi:hypothetical protein
MFSSTETEGKPTNSSHDYGFAIESVYHTSSKSFSGFPKNVEYSKPFYERRDRTSYKSRIMLVVELGPTGFQAQKKRKTNQFISCLWLRN